MILVYHTDLDSFPTSDPMSEGRSPQTLPRLRGATPQIFFWGRFGGWGGYYDPPIKVPTAKMTN